jgi:tetratricopeptide (TPR) repeat protein
MDDRHGAVEVYRALVGEAPGETRYRVALANALAIGGENEQAIDVLELAWRLDRRATREVNRLLADLYLAERMPHEAALCYGRAIRETEEPSADDYFRLGAAYFQSGEFLSAGEALEAMRETEPNDYRADLYLGHAAIEQHDPNRAEEHYRAALAKQPTATDVLLALGQLQMQEKRFEAAAGFFERVIELGDRQALVHYNHVLALMRTPGREQEAEAALKAALARHPGDAQIQQLLDRYVRQMGAFR